MCSNRNSSDDGAEYKRTDVRRDYIASVKFTNTLPDVPYPPKFIRRKPDLSKFVDYTNNSFIRKRKRSILAEQDIGVHTELIDPEVYGIGKCNKNSSTIEPHWKDLLLLEDEYHNFREKNRSETHSTPVSFMNNKMRPPRRSQTLSSATKPSTRIETKIGYNLEKGGEIQLHQTREQQIETIQKQFEDVKIPCMEHYAKKGVYAVEELPILPDFEYLGHSLMLAEFPTYPDPSDVSENCKKEALKLSQIINTEEAYGHFIPTPQSLRKLIKVMNNDQEEDFKTEYKYKVDREYTYAIKPCAEEFYLRFTGDSVVYGPLEDMKVVLSRLRNPGERKQILRILNVKHRRHTPEEIAEISNKMERLLTDKVKEEIKKGEKEEKPEEIGKKKPAKKIKPEEIEEPILSSESSDLSSVSSSSDEYEPSKRNLLSDDDDDLPRHLKMKIKKEPESYSSSDSS